MHSIVLVNTGRTTSRLGYGCSSLMGALDKRRSLALLDVAYDNGIRHFDVAPMYGYGEAEVCLGEFAGRHRDITIATKFGLLPARSRPWMRTARRVAGKLLRHAPALKQRLAPASDTIAGAGAKASFDVRSAQTSLESSLRNLDCEHIDLWLLHEAEAADLNDDALLRFLEDAQASGKIGSFGVGGEARHLPQLLAERAAYCPVLQLEWSLFDAPLVLPRTFRVHYRSLSARFRALQHSLAADAKMRRRWSSYVGLDLTEDDTLAALMLKASLELNPTSIILFSAKAAEKILLNVAAEASAELAKPATRLHEIVRSRCAQGAHDHAM